VPNDPAADQIGGKLRAHYKPEIRGRFLQARRRPGTSHRRPLRPPRSSLGREPRIGSPLAPATLQSRGVPV